MIPLLLKNKILFKYTPILLVSILAIFISILGCTSKTALPKQQAETSGFPIPQSASAKTLQKTADVLSVSIDLNSGSIQSLETKGEDYDIKLMDPGGTGGYQFNPSQITLTSGKIYSFQLISETEAHSFTIEKSGIDQWVEANETIEFNYAFSTPGKYQLICIPHQALGMVAEIIVQ
jgi:plastocyanin